MEKSYEKTIQTLLEEVSENSNNTEKQQEITELKESLKKQEDTIKKQNKAIRGQGNTLLEQGKFLDEVDKKFTDVSNQIDKKAKEGKTDTIQLVSLFVTFFTFASVEINIIKNSYTSLSLAGLTFINLGSLSFFAIVITHLIFLTNIKENITEEEIKKQPKNIYKTFYLISASFIILGLGSLFFEHRESQKYVFIDNKNDRQDYYVLDKDQISKLQNILESKSIQNIEKSFASSTRESSVIKNCLLDDEVYGMYQLKNCLQKN